MFDFDLFVCRILKDKFVYGIKTFSVYSNRLRSIVEPCTKAKTSADARDKYFLELVSEVDISAGLQLQQAGQLAANASISMAARLSAVEEITQNAKRCVSEKQATSERNTAFNAQVVDLMNSLARLGDLT